MNLKKVIDDKGTFQVSVPPTWKYWVMEGEVHSFEDNEIDGDSDCFQFSINLLTNDQRTELAHLLGFLPPLRVGDFDCRCHEDEAGNDGYITKLWSTIYGMYHLYFTFTYLAKREKNHAKVLQSKLEKVYKIIESFYMIQDDERERVLISYRFEMFLQGISASNLLLQKAVENRAFFEATCLLGNQIDSLLRLCIVLKKQILKRNKLIEKEWIYQGAEDKKKSEKDIYKTALLLDIITDVEYKSLFRLYDDRNRVIHRFIISEITLAEVEEISCDYYFLREEIQEILNAIEAEQLKQNIGMTITEKEDDGSFLFHLSNIVPKIGTLSYFVPK